MADINSVMLGDILVGDASYSMTFYHFYKVVGKTSCSLKLQKLKKISLPGGDQAATEVKPVLDSADGPVITRRPNKWGAMHESDKYSAYISLDRKYSPENHYIECYLD